MYNLFCFKNIFDFLFIRLFLKILDRIAIIDIQGIILKQPSEGLGIVYKLIQDVNNTYANRY
jgi:hypothetical protein